jgi:hypothetical protein
MSTQTALPVATCVAALEEIIVNKAMEGEIQVGPVARWSTGEEIRVVGKWRSKGFFAQWAIRWVSGNGKGLFGKGLAGYCGGLDERRIAGLPLVK